MITDNNRTNTPLVSFLMSVYNGEEYLEETLDSIISQSYSNWELIAINDCSTDSTADILAKYADRDGRIRVYANDKNLRLQKSLNKGLGLVSGDYIARIDADDVCYSRRLEEQVEYMEMHPEIELSSCRNDIIENGQIKSFKQSRRGDSDTVKALLLFYNPIVHPGVIMRRTIADNYRYNEECTCSEDYELWTRLAADNHKLAVQNKALIKYRIHPGQITDGPKERDKKQYISNASAYYKKMLFELSTEEADKLYCAIYRRDNPDAAWCSDFFKSIEKANHTSNSFSYKSICVAELEVAMDYYRSGAGTALLIKMILRHPFVVIPEIFRTMLIKK